MNRLKASPAALALCVALLAPACATAQSAPATPGTEQIIESLKPQPARTRSLRNLIVREKAAEGESAASAASAASGSAEPSQAAAAEVPSPPPSISMAIQFDFDSARLRPQGEAALDNLAAALKSPQLSASRFLVEGHTDAKGTAAYNQRLSQLRADEVRRYLLAQGVGPDRVDAVGRGAQEPANAADRFAAENRRVRVVNVDPERMP